MSVNYSYCKVATLPPDSAFFLSVERSWFSPEDLLLQTKDLHGLAWYDGFDIEFRWAPIHVNADVFSPNVMGKLYEQILNRCFISFFQGKLFLRACLCLYPVYASPDCWERYIIDDSCFQLETCHSERTLSLPPIHNSSEQFSINQ